MESVAAWQAVALSGFLSWIGLASYINITQKLRSLLQPWAARHVVNGAPLVLRIQVCDYREPIVSFFCSRLWLGLLCNGFVVCRNIRIGSWMRCFLGCLALFLCPSTLLFFLCYFGYALSLFVIVIC